MDFALSDDLLELRALAATIFADLGADEGLWAELGRTGLLGLAVPEDHGGAGLGLDAVCVLLEEQGRRVADAAAWPHAVAALAVARHAPGETDMLKAAADGSRRLTLALEEYDGAEPTAPRCTAVPGPDAGQGQEEWLLTGVKAVVPTPEGADHVLVSATAPDGPGLFLLTGDAAWEPALTTSLDQAGDLHLDATPARRLGGEQALAEVLRWATLALAALQVGVAEGAVRIAADYVSGRHQFGRPIGSFQAVQHQLADCWTDVEAMRLTLWQALTADADGEDADAAALVASWWCGQSGLDVVHRVQHVHGGIGVDVDYPVHRHFLWGKQIASTLGGPEVALHRLGDLVAGGTVAS